MMSALFHSAILTKIGPVSLRYYPTDYLFKLNTEGARSGGPALVMGTSLGEFIIRRCQSSHTIKMSRFKLQNSSHLRESCMKL